MKRVLLISRFSEESVALKKEIAKNKAYGVDMASTAQQALTEITNSLVDLVIFNLDQFTKKKIQLASDLRSLGYNFPVLVLADTIGGDSYSSLSEIKNTVLLEKPFENKDLHGLTEKLIKGRPVSQRIFRRFYTNQIAEVEALKRGQKFPTRVRNLSKGGAFLEFKIGHLRQGDILRVNIELQDVARQYDVMAKVVWATPKSPWGDGKGAGIEFVPSNQVYSKMLQGI